ncbi:MAG TPA: hypothetical protein VM056_04540 [Terriglobales bacterium]|nr:hypothetical protein [Terriglobales bacterium]
MGYKNVRDYEGGKKDWIDAGFPIETGAAGASSKPAEKKSEGSVNASTNPDKGIA